MQSIVVIEVANGKDAQKMLKELHDFVLHTEVDDDVHFQGVTRVPVIAFSVPRKLSEQF